MCGIAGYIGSKNAQTVLLDSLQRVTYRGYDSFGVAVRNGNGIRCQKAVGTVEGGRNAIKRVEGTAGIGHTRWATVGKVSKENAHPHMDCGDSIAVVHNGDIENYVELRRRLIADGHRFRSETDSEVIAHLIEAHRTSDMLSAVREAVKEIEGSYAIVVLHEKAGELIAARQESPLVLAIGDHETFAASDAPAVLPYTNKFVYMEDGDVARLTPDGVQVWANGHEAKRTVHQVDWNVDQLDRGGFAHYMLKEIHEQPQAAQDTIASVQNALRGGASYGVGLPSFKGAKAFSPNEILLLGCGTSFHAGLIAKPFIERLTGVRVDAEVATEFQCRTTSAKGALAIALSQSGETSDTLAAIKKVKSNGYHTMGITNVVGSSISRATEEILFTQAGPEVAVAATKTFIAQVVALYCFGLSMKGVDPRKRASLERHLRKLPNQLRRLLSDTQAFEDLGRSLAAYDSLFIIARGRNYPVALEGALKFKEVAYVHAEGCPAGELKHGPFALLGPKVPVLAIVGQDDQRVRMHTAIREIKARGSRVIAVTTDDDDETGAFTDELLKLPATNPVFSPVINAVAMQLLSYYCALERGCPIDRPRNLAKSVTVH